MLPFPRRVTIVSGFRSSREGLGDLFSSIPAVGAFRILSSRGSDLPQSGDSGFVNWLQFRN